MSTAPAPERTHWAVVGFAVGVGVVAAMQVGKVPPALPSIRSELGITMVAGGWVASLFSVVAAVLGLLTGYVSDRMGARPTMAVALGALILSSVAGALAPSLPWLLAARVVESFGFLGIVVAAPAMIVEATAVADRRLSVGIWSAYLPAGFALMLLIAPYIMAEFGWRGLWFSNAALMTVILLAFVTVVPKASASSEGRLVSRAAISILATLRRPGLWLLSLCFMLYALQWFALMTWLPSFLIETQGWTAATVGLVMALVVLVNVGGNLGGTWLLQRNTPRWSLVAASAIITGVAGGSVFIDAVPLEMKVMLAFVYSLACGVTPAAAMTGAVAHAPSPAHIAASNGLIVQGAQSGSLMGPPILAWIVADGGTWQHGLWLFAACSGLSVCLALLLRWREKGL